MKNLTVLLLPFLIACNSDQSSNKPEVPLSDTIEKTEAGRTPTNEGGKNHKPLTAKSELAGIWASNNKEPLTVEITSDSIYYAEHFESHKYSLKGDSIFISYPDFTFAAKVYFIKDTLVMESEDGKSKYYSFKG